MPAATFTDIFEGQEIAGAILSVTVTVNEHVAVNGIVFASDTTNVFVVTPFG